LTYFEPLRTFRPIAVRVVRIVVAPSSSGASESPPTSSAKTSAAPEPAAVAAAEATSGVRHVDVGYFPSAREVRMAVRLRRDDERHSQDGCDEENSDTLSHMYKSSAMVSDGHTLDAAVSLLLSPLPSALCELRSPLIESGVLRQFRECLLRNCPSGLQIAEIRPDAHIHEMVSLDDAQ
jgi:hypothetical protein